MAATWEFYVAMFLVFVAIMIVVVLVFLLLNPSSDLFDRISSLFNFKKKKKGAVKTQTSVTKKTVSSVVNRPQSAGGNTLHNGRVNAGQGVGSSNHSNGAVPQNAPGQARKRPGGPVKGGFSKYRR